MPSTFIQVHNETSESAAVTKAYNVRDTTGSTLYFQGNASAAYNFSGLVIPRNTNILGDGLHAIISGNPTIEGTVGFAVHQGVTFSEGCSPFAIRDTTFRNCKFTGTVAMTGPCYYNYFQKCYWRVLGSTPCLTTVDNNQNLNYIVACRTYYEGMGFDLSCPATEEGYSNGWAFVGSGFEGNPDAASDAVLGPAIKLAGRAHFIGNGCWFERGLSRSYSPNHAVTLLDTTYNCEVGTCEWGHLTTIYNGGGALNIMPPYLVGLGGRIVTP